LGYLGIQTLPTNPLGWFLILVGAAYIIGLVIVIVIRKNRVWDSPLNGRIIHEEGGDRSLWFVTMGMIAAFFLSPLEYLYLPDSLSVSDWMAYSGLVLVTSGTIMFIWARLVLGMNYSGHLSVTTEQVLVQCGPYRLIRHPAYAGYLLMAFGIGLGYASIVGLASVLLLLLMLTYRIRLEEEVLTEHFGEDYRMYALKTKRLIPWVW
jgi:protein-S-isoprenylcysteine O-methyltransferase Ste14